MRGLTLPSRSFPERVLAHAVLMFRSYRRIADSAGMLHTGGLEPVEFYRMYTE